MKFFPTGAESAAIDKKTIEEIGIPQMVLMERASLALAEETAKLAEETVKLADKKKRILVICEGGNNGGDGIAAARILHEWGFSADVFHIGGLNRSTEAFEKQKEIALKCGVEFISCKLAVSDQKIGSAGDAPGSAENSVGNDVYELYEALSGYDVIVDAIFGVGLSREVAGVQADIINAINKAKEERREITIVAADIPSGISAESGNVLGTAVRADVTVTFGFTKLGMLFGAGREYSGRIITRDIGFPGAVYNLKNDAWSIDKNTPGCTEDLGDRMNIGCYGYDTDDVKRLLPVRRADANKGSFGKLLIVAGNSEISGAAVIAGQAAFRAGAGLVKIFTDKANRNIIGAALPEALIKTYEKNKLRDELSDDNNDKNDCSETIRREVGWASAVAIGPGLGTDDTAVKLLQAVLDAAAEYDKPVVMDADAINIISEKRDILENFQTILNKKTKWIITPHMLEMARLVKKEDEDVRTAMGRIIDNRFEVAKWVANEYNVVSILKDARTVISDGGDSFYVNINGNSGMAKGGSGDSLTGIVGSLLAQGMKPVDAATAGVFIHGAAGDIAAVKYGITGMTVSNLNDSIKDVI